MGQSKHSFDTVAAAVRLRRMLTAAVFVLGMVVLIERLGYAGAYRSSGIDWHEFAIQIVLSAPAILNLGALWQFRAAAASAARRQPFGSTASVAVRRVGLLLTASAIAAIAIAALLTDSLGKAQPRSLDLDLSSMVLGAIGLTMVFIGRLIEQAGAAQRELEEFF